MIPLLRGVDRAAFAAALAARLRSEGVPVGLSALEDLARALSVVPPDSRPRLYWAARITLVRRQPDLAAFDAVFAAVFADAMPPVGSRRGDNRTPPKLAEDESLVAVPRGFDESGEPQGTLGLPWATLPPVVSSAGDTDSDTAVPQRLASDLEALTDLPFEALSEGETELLGRWLEACLRSWPTRRTRRRRPGSAGRQVALRATVARSRRTGWEPVELVRVRAVTKPRKVVMLCDVSQSMQPQIGAYFHLMRALTVVLGGEAFSFSTSLTRLTPLMRHRSAAQAVAEATEQVTDRFGGTRIATSLNALLSSHHGNAMRGGIVIIGSDGWDSEPPDRLANAMARLSRRAHRVVWINPRAAAPGFEPLVGTMAAALPFCDDFLPAGDFRALAAAVTELGRATRASGGC
ncbi:vWA domain-containing protein [Lapillicoccus sp.]|uniref:vWA domain-containing protein n=1 Tax=Lapillicoccus sp. TaxID=1909287 RepID=UPI0039834A6D